MNKYYLKEEFEVNNNFNSFWVSIFNFIYDLTNLINNNKENKDIDTFISLGGKELDYMFDKNSKEPLKKYNNNFQNYNRSFLLLDNLDFFPDSNNKIKKPWWNDKKLIIGKWSKKERKIRIINTLTHHDDILNVPTEELLNNIQERYLKLNFHSRSYTWKNLDEKILDMNSNLEENKILDENDEYNYYDIPYEERYIPVVLIFYNDDLTIS